MVMEKLSDAGVPIVFNVELKIDEVNTINNKKDKLAVIDLSAPDAFPIFYLKKKRLQLQGCVAAM